MVERAGIRLDPHRREVCRDGKPVALTRKEFGVLHELLRADALRMCVLPRRRGPPGVDVPLPRPVPGPPTRGGCCGRYSRSPVTARRVAETNLHERIALTGPRDELRDLADTINAMLERLDRAFDSQRRFVANASHELRTPLTINRTLIEVALDDPDVTDSTRRLGCTLLAVNERHERLIDGMLVLAGSQQLVTRTWVDLADSAHRVVGLLNAAAERAAVQIRTAVALAEVVGDPILLERLLHNLVDNAIRYNAPEKGWVAVSVSGRDNRVTVTVENSGHIVPDAGVKALFEPFRRSGPDERSADGSRGAGLGLSIVESIAVAHGGRVDAVARREGGLTVTVELPSGQ